MIDWFTGVTLYDSHYLKPDVVYRVDRDGQVLWTKECMVEAVGSYSDKLLLQSASSAPALVPTRQGYVESSALLRISGNPVKFLQGHNAFGCEVSELDNLILCTVMALPDNLRPEDADLARFPVLRKSRIDIAKMINLESHANVHAWLKAFMAGSRNRSGRALASGSTIYLGKNSRRWTLKAYCKACEMLRHPMADLAKNEFIRKAVEGMLRLELTLRGHELEHMNIQNEDILWKFFDRITTGVLDMSRVHDIDELPWSTQGVVLRWLGGEDVMAMMSKTTRYRHRRIIMNELGVDIAISAKEQEQIVDHLKLDGKYLKEHEVKSLPQLILQGLIYKPEPQLAFGVC